MKTRKDGTLIRESDPFHSIVPYVMPKRTEAEVSITETFDVSALIKYMNKRNKKEGLNLKLFHAFCTATARTIYLRPKMNIFISGKRFWQRKDISLSFVAKQKFADEAVETLMFLKAKPDMNIDDFSRIILGDVKKAREKSGNDLDGLMNFVGKLPRFILEIVFFVVRRLEYHGIVPEALTNGDPNYSTVLLSNLGSIGAGAPYHHLSNYGTCSIMVTIGTIKTVDKKSTLDVTFTIDERIADGFYFAKSLRVFHYLFAHPELLTEPVSNGLPEDIF